MANAIDLQFADWRNGAAYHALAEVPSGTETVWAGYETMNYVTLFVFTTTAPTTGVTLAYYGGSNGGTNDSSGDVILNYRLLDAASSDYENANASSTADGSFTWRQGSQTVSITQTLSAGTHYLYIWSGRANSYLNYGSFTVSTTNLSITYTGAASYKFTASVSTGITGTFTIYSSPYGRSGSISSGATIYNGEVLQIGSPGEIYNHPNQAVVAGFVGVSNEIDGRFVRPEHLRLTREPLPADMTAAVSGKLRNLPVQIVQVRFGGMYYDCTITDGTKEYRVAELNRGEGVTAWMPGEKGFLSEADHEE